MKILSLLLLAPLAWCASGVESPPLGFARSGAGGIVRVSGIAGAFIAAPTGQGEVVSAAFNGTRGLVKLATSVRALDAAGELAAEWDAPEGPALFGFDPAGSAAIVWYTSSGTFSVLRAAEWSAVPIDAASLGGDILAVSLADSRRALILVAREHLVLVRVRLSDGATERETMVGDGSGPATLWPGGAVLYRSEGGFVYRDPRGSEQTVELPAGELTQMGSGWVQVRTAAAGQFAIRIGGVLRVYELPEVSQ